MSTRGKQKREKLHGRQRGTDRFHRWPRRSRLRRRSTYKSARVFPSYQHCKLKMRWGETGQSDHWRKRKKKRGGREGEKKRKESLFGPASRLIQQSQASFRGLTFYNRPLFLYGKSFRGVTLIKHRGKGASKARVSSRKSFCVVLEIVYCRNGSNLKVHLKCYWQRNKTTGEEVWRALCGLCLDYKFLQDSLLLFRTCREIVGFLGYVEKYHVCVRIFAFIKCGRGIFRKL